MILLDFIIKGGNHMSFQKVTKRNIVRTTGVSFARLLEDAPTTNNRLRILKRSCDTKQIDWLVRGNPQ